MKVSAIKKNPITDQRGKQYDCVVCGVVFRSYKGSKNRKPKFCSSACYGKSLAKPTIQTACKHCGDLFTNTNKRTYCTHACSALARRQLAPKQRQYGYFMCLHCSTEFKSNKACKTRTPKFCSRQCSNLHITDETRNKMSVCKKGLPAWNRGVAMWANREHPRGTLGKTFIKAPISDETRRRMSEAQKNRKSEHLRGHLHPNWQGGISNKNEAIRKSRAYKTWRQSVFERDNYTCLHCQQRGVRLHADHIKPFAFYPDLRFDLSNGQTLCEGCHRKTDTYGRKALNYAGNCLQES